MLSSIASRRILSVRNVSVYLLLAAGLFKAGLLAFIGPSPWPDTGLYVEFADAILDHGRAFAPIAWGVEAVPPFIFRLAGYPLILAAAKLLTPGYWQFLVVAVQGALNGVVIWLFLKVSAQLLRSGGAALVAAILYTFSGSMLWDNSLLSDSIYASLFNIVVLTLLGQVIGSWRLSRFGVAGLAVLWGYSILTRDSGLYFTFIPLILLLAGTISDKGRIERRSDQAAQQAIVFLVIVGGMVGGYVLLNWYRTGEAFFGITGVENWLRPVFDMARYGYAQPFSGDDLVSQTVRETMTQYDLAAQKQFFDALHARCRCTPTQMQSLVFAKYLSAVWQHPIAYARVVVVNFNIPGLGSNLADPVATVNQFAQLGTPLARRIVPGVSIRRLHDLTQHFAVADLCLMILSAISTAISVALFALFMFGIPVLGIRAWRKQETMTLSLCVAGFFRFVFMSVSLAFSMVHFEARQALPVLPAGEFGIVYMLMRSRGARRADSVT
jgi:hypothetical protein